RNVGRPEGFISCADHRRLNGALLPRRSSPSVRAIRARRRPPMDLGFETCGNASIIAVDHGAPVLVTDPWIEGAQYFGSWSLPYRFTELQQDAFRNVRYAWISHGHPDHLNLASL